jgi:two-component system chemotaxis response regulator CheY
VGKIFVVDDEVFIQDLYQAMLPAGGHEIVDSAFNGQEAVDKFRALAERPDLVIMDHRMPIKNGLDATREIMAVDPSARVLVISADATVESKYQNSGAVGFIEKPFTMDVLFSAISVSLKGAHLNPSP